MVMKKFLKYYLVVAALCIIGQQSQAQELNSGIDTVSYSLGVVVAKNMKAQGFEEMSLEQFIAGIRDVMNGEELLFPASQAETYMRAYAAAKQKEAAAKGAVAGEENLIEGQKFLEENAKREGVISLDNGLQYEVLNAAQTAGPKPTTKQTVTVHYHGTLINGEVFDSSVERGETIEFELNRVIKGWTEILQHMTVGDKWRVFIPSDLAYGERSAGPKIGPNSTLIFEIELLGIK